MDCLSNLSPNRRADSYFGVFEIGRHLGSANQNDRFDCCFLELLVTTSEPATSHDPDNIRARRARVTTSAKAEHRLW